MDATWQGPGLRGRRPNSRRCSRRSSEGPLPYGGGLLHLQPKEFARDSCCRWYMEGEKGAPIRRPVVSDPASLRLHDPFDEVQPQTVTGHVGSDFCAAIECLEQMALIGFINTRPVVQ